ncbi:16S rRNA (guanine(966)-N(2))-methyltransferase RsmD [Saccharopolyspora halophila]|uniref:16S rRNA (Guanine(966)-N(2))-methyltransferase RsmD n=1 Tax=Saccharopolyspora halophila TaxID=405551 RepID=A0ABP5TN31_9PSEU
MREAVFNALESLTDLDGARVLDLYGGSGALGLEALSRGAGHVTFVESDKRAVGVLRRNAASLGFRQLRVEQAKAETAVSAPAPEPFDVVLADPPYDLSQEALQRVLDGLVAGGWTAPGSVLIVERAVRGGEPDWPPPLHEFRVKRYGGTAVHWAAHEETEED